MRYMGWTWFEYQTTPAFVIDRLIETVQHEAKQRGGPREQRQPEH